MNNNSSRIFIFIFVTSLVVMSPYIIGNYIMKSNDDEIVEEDIELSKEENVYVEEEKTSNIESNIIIESNVTSNVEIQSNVVSNIESNKPSNKTSKVVSNKSSNEVKQETNTGKVNTVEKPPMTYTSFRKVGNDYFNDALFIGDSRTEGLRLYGTLKNATYFSTTGLSTYGALGKSINVKGIGNVTLSQLLQQKTFSKIYVMLGINEVGGNANNIASKYGQLINLIKQYQTNSIIYIEGNLHVAKSRNDRDKSINNNRINTLNGKMASYANDSDIIYIDINYLFDDENGNLKSDMTSDATHVYAKYYKDWCNWLMEHAAS